jgi:acyl carrier protein
MEIKEFIANFADQFDETDAEVFTPETKFRELEEWSSLIALSVMSMIDDEYDVQLTANEMRDAQTIQDLFNIVNSK